MDYNLKWNWACLLGANQILSLAKNGVVPDIPALLEYLKVLAKYRAIYEDADKSFKTKHEDELQTIDYLRDNFKRLDTVIREWIAVQVAHVAPLTKTGYVKISPSKVIKHLDEETITAHPEKYGFILNEKKVYEVSPDKVEIYLHKAGVRGGYGALPTKEEIVPPAIRVQWEKIIESIQGGENE